MISNLVEILIVIYFTYRYDITLKKGESSNTRDPQTSDDLKINENKYKYDT